MTENSSIKVNMGQPKATDLEFSSDRCLVLPDDAEVKTKSGLILPDTAKDKPFRGTLIVKGNQISIEFDRDYKIGDKVIYGKYAGTEIELESQDGTIKSYMIMRESDIMAKIKNNN